MDADAAYLCAATVLDHQSRLPSDAVKDAPGPLTRNHRAGKLRDDEVATRKCGTYGEQRSCYL
jgi:hypothetical protein